MGPSQVQLDTLPVQAGAEAEAEAGAEAGAGCCLQVSCPTEPLEHFLRETTPFRGV